MAGRMLDGDKVYDFTVMFGVETDTLDAEGVAVATSEVRPTWDAVEAVLLRFTGAIAQVPPAYSALKVDGARAYDLARAGEEVVLATRDVTVRSLILSSPARGRCARSATEGEEAQLSYRVLPLRQPAAATSAWRGRI